MTMLERAACLVGRWDLREPRRRAGWWTERAVIILVPDDQGRNGDALRIEVESRLRANGQVRHRRRQDHAPESSQGRQEAASRHRRDTAVACAHHPDRLAPAVEGRVDEAL